MSQADQKTMPKINSLAAPTADDIAALRAMSPHDRQAIVAEHIAQGTSDIKNGKFTSLESDEDIRSFFDEIWSVE